MDRLHVIRKALLVFAIGAIAVGLLIQLLPIGRDHNNPPVIAEPPWNSPETRAIAQRTCFDCHSNETVYPWYSNVAPMSWLLANHIRAGRDELNFSEYNPRDFPDAEDIEEVIREGEMPLPQYLLLHPEARLTDAEKTALIEGLKRTLEGE